MFWGRSTRSWNASLPPRVSPDMMRRSIALLAALLLPFARPLPTQASDDLLARMAAVGGDLHTYTATLRAHVALRTFPFLATDVAGTYYFKAPDRSKLVITSGLPMVAKAFGTLYPHIEPPALWPTYFTVTRTQDDGTTANFRLVPRKHGNVDHIDVRVDVASATVTAMRWSYVNGGSATMHDTYADVQGHTVVVAQTGSVDEPGYKGDITSTLTNYAFNAPIDDAVFAPSR